MHIEFGDLHHSLTVSRICNTLVPPDFPFNKIPRWPSQNAMHTQRNDVFGLLDVDPVSGVCRMNDLPTLML